MRGMPRSPVTDAARDVRVTIRTTVGEHEEITRLRGALSVSDYLRGLIRADAARRRVARTPSEG